MKLHKPIWLVCLLNRWRLKQKARRDKEVDKIEQRMTDQLKNINR